MKRIFALILALCTLLSLAACSSSLEEGGTQTGVKETKTDTEKEEKETGEITLPEGFSVGYARADINPTLPVTLGSHETATKIQDDILATCIAISDGETVALLFAMDMKDVPEKLFENCAKEIEKAVGIPKTNIIMNGTHTHSCPHTTSTADPANIKWQQKVRQVSAQIAEEAMRDLAPAEIYTGEGDTTGFAFVRRYLMADGTYKGLHSANPSEDYKAHETEADPELRTIRFDREGDKQDIILANWQAHAAHAATEARGTISADFVAQVRDGVEESMDSLFAYFNGGSGNINLSDSLGNRKYDSYRDVGKALVDVVKSAVQNEEKAESGKISVQTSELAGNVFQDSEERRQQAKEYSAAADGQKEAILNKYGFISQYDAIAVNTRAAMESVTDIPLTAISFGEVAICCNPFEMFDTNARQIREGSPFKMTFVCGYSNGSFGYLPSAEAYPHGEYEVYVSRFADGTSDAVVAESIRLLTQAKNAG